MAKGNMLLGMARGSVGDVTFYRDGGLQRARSRNRQPNNPRSNKQQTQRALFANCVKFYKLTAAKFYKFAYENKKVNESDYNAFMRENLKRGVMISKSAFYTEAYPALGNWLMSRGSLATIVNANDDNTQAPIFDLGATWSGTPDDNVTIGAMSTAMIASGRYQVGDIITMVRFSTKSLGQVLPSATPDATKLQSLFEYFQFLVDPNSAQKFLDLVGDTPRFHLVATATTGTLAIEYGIDGASALEDWTDDYNGVTIIHSRNTAQGLRVSTQELVVNPNYQTAIETALTDATYKSAVLADWSAEGLAILQGEGLELVDPNDVGDYIVGNYLNGSTHELTTHNVENCTVGDGYSVYIQCTNQLTDEQVMAIIRRSIVSAAGMDVDYTVNINTDTAPGSLYGYSAELLTIVSLPATLTLRTQSGDTRIAAYTSA